MKFLLLKFYHSLKFTNNNGDSEFYLLNENEYRKLNFSVKTHVLLSAFIGGLMVLLLYLPQYTYPSLFPEKTYTLPLIGNIKFNLNAFIFGLILIFIELLILGLISMSLIHKISDITGYITNKDIKIKNDQYNNIGLEKKEKSQKNYGIYPYQGLPIWLVVSYNLLIILKATLSNLVFKILVKRLLGRYALREILDLSGVPIFAFWNAFATYQVAKQAKLYIMGQGLIQQYIKQLPESVSENEKTIIYDTLQYIAISKRDYHYNHAVMTEQLIKKYNINTEKIHLLPKDYFTKLTTLIPEERIRYKNLVLMGYILDGNLSKKELKEIEKLNSSTQLSLKSIEIKEKLKDFVQGKGVNFYHQ